jgi:hypothetical protein
MRQMVGKYKMEKQIKAAIPNEAKEKKTKEREK